MLHFKVSNVFTRYGISCLLAKDELGKMLKEAVVAYF